jgi:hypothetical protein
MTPDNNKNHIENVDYSMPFLKSKRFLLTVGTLLFLTVFSGVSLTKKIDDIVYSALTANPRCPITLENYEIKFFLPRLELTNIKIPRNCSTSLKNDLKISKVNIHIRGFAFSPLGLHFKADTKIKNNPLSAYITTGFSEIAVRITDNTIKVQNFKEFIPLVKLRGDIKLDALINLKNLKLTGLMLNARSNNFKIPSQSIMGLSIKQLNLDNLKVILDSTGQKSKIKVKELVIGKSGAPIEANFKGLINLNNRNIQASKLDLAGEVKISDEMAKNFALIKMYLDSFDKKDDYYQIQIAGPLSRPKLTSRR